MDTGGQQDPMHYKLHMEYHTLYLMAYIREVPIHLSCSWLKWKEQAGPLAMLFDAHLTLR